MTISEKEFREALAAKKMRATDTRLGILSVLEGSPQPMLISQIVTQLPESHFVSVYRSVDALCRAGIIKQVPLGFKNCFELSDVFLPHHHHATCEVCGISYSIEHEKIEKLYRSYHAI